MNALAHHSARELELIRHLSLAYATATGNTGAGTAHSHTLSDANAKLKKPSDGADATHGGGMPDRFYLNWYMRQ